MRTLQEKYTGIQEGKFSKDQFLRDARMEFPNLVTQYNGYTDAVQILKNRGMIQEAVVEEARLTKNSLTDYRYKPTNDMDKYPYEQILRGLRVELEGLGVTSTPTPEEYKKALAKVLKNLEKDEIFYTNQIAGNSKKVDNHDQMVDVQKDNAVDKYNGMKKAQLKEAIKGAIKNILSEEAAIEAPLHGEEEFEMQGPKSDLEFKSELDDYLQDNQIYGYTNRIHDIMTQEDPNQAAGDLALFLDDNQIYGYNRGIEAIYAEYPYEDMYENYEGEEEADDIPHPRGYEEASDEETFEDLFESVSLKDLL